MRNNYLCFKNTLLPLFIMMLSSCGIISQKGCTDVLANNYNPSAMLNDGSCVYTPELVSTSHNYILDDVLSETSGLIYWNGVLWTHNDNGDNILYKLNPNDGSIAGNISLDPQINKDWEAITQDGDYIYVGDFGNNLNGNRTDLKILRISKTSIIAGNPQIDIISFSFSDQSDFSPTGTNNTNYDCEAFIIKDDFIFLFTKEWISNKTRVYKLPKVPGEYSAELQSTYDVQGLITDAVYYKDRGIIALCGYSKLLQPFVFLLYDFEDDKFFSGNKRKLNIDLPFHQVEGIATNDGLNYFITNEKFDVSGTIQQLHTLNLTEFLKE